MDVLNRLKTVVTNVLPVGNPITNELEIHGHRASGGPGMMWKIYDGAFKSSKQEASIFIFEKRQLDRFTRRDRDHFLDILKKGVTQLTKLRHPKILSVVHPLEDSRESLAFATEPIFTSLANVLGNHDNLPNPPPPYLKDFSLFDVEIRYGLLQVAEGLSFLHNSAHIIQGNCCPESIYINKLGCWKMAGFEHSITNANVQGEPYYPYPEYDQHADPLTQPKLNYLAPEYGLTGTCDTSSDLFSFGMLVYAVYNKGVTLYDCMHDWKTYKINVSELRNLPLSRLQALPDIVRDHVKLLFNIDATLRPDADQLSKIPFFEDVGVVTLVYLDLLVQKDNLQKSQFFKDLTPVVAKLPKRVNIQRVLPSISKECHNNNMVPFILPTIIEVAKLCSNDEYTSHVMPSLIPLFKMAEPIQITFIFLQNMSFLLSKTTQNDIRNHILPLISRALEVNIPQMQDLCLNIMPSFASEVEYSSLKNIIIPRVCKLCLAQNSLSIRVNCLVCLGKLLEYLDKWYVLDEVLPVLQTIQSREPAVLMSILGIYKVALTHKKLGITKEMLANKILPFLMSMCIDNNLNLSQFNSFMLVIKDMLNRVENEHRMKLEQLDSVQQEQKTLQRFAQESIQTSGAACMDKIPFNPFDEPMTSPPSSSSSLLSTTTTTATNNNARKIMHPLTMEEKEKLARQQEQQLRFQTSNTPLQPSSSTSTSTSTTKILNSNSNKSLATTTTSTTKGPKDLTSTLINNNLSMLSFAATTTATTSTSLSAPLSTFSSSSLSSSYNNAGFNQGYSTMGAFNNNQQQQIFNNQQQLFNSGNKVAQHFPSTKPQSVNISAFDSINTGINQRTNKSQPMKSMMIISNQSSTNQSSTNQSQFVNHSTINRPTFNQQQPQQPYMNNFNQQMNFNFPTNNPNFNTTTSTINDRNILGGGGSNTGDITNSTTSNGSINTKLSTKDIQDLLG